ncbi:Aliphatic amidase expression-regulating protein (plasmid) [Sulfitobacter sp. THAF37]|uniref:substrate-binding domain-containing protein n=1 Tax=Sulfitobacter sp. THAF37 TaxID=2587855 RepID=UPI0012A79CD6|nr:substrate-binding domain-containing protein [Sulfitobacter sp. THAF37]QFT61152.1 Aliphatic amidase expression-regulating protein [Sulfitobacter sp. THAF37]
MECEGCHPDPGRRALGHKKEDAALPIELADFRASGLLAASGSFRVALLIPMCGSAGIWAPSCISSAQVAAAELNRKDGIGGRRVQLIMIDAAVEADEPIEETVNDLIELNAIDAIVGMHLSAVRQRLSKVVRQRIPYIYTPLYEGGETTPGLFAIGETPAVQLAPAMAALQAKYRPRSWAMVGNDYVWPRSSHSLAKSFLKSAGVDLAMECYVPFGLPSLSGLVDRVEASGAEAVLVSLVGQDAVNFNRQFGRRGLHRKAVRLSCALEENGLMACGRGNLERMFSVSSYFGSITTDANAGFKERYFGLHGDAAPALNAIGQSTYEGLHYLAALLRDYPAVWHLRSSRDILPVIHPSGRSYARDAGLKRPDVYLARADGVQFSDFKLL